LLFVTAPAEIIAASTLRWTKPVCITVDLGYDVQRSFAPSFGADCAGGSWDPATVGNRRTE